MSSSLSTAVQTLEGTGGIPMVKLTSTTSTAEVYLFGACVTSWKPSNDRDLLFVRPDAVFNGIKPISGGIPHCFPQFGPGAMQQHGFARNMNWSVVDSDDSQEEPTVTFELKDTPYSRSMWDFSFHALYKVALNSKSLATTLTVKNTDDKAFSFNSALHTYFSSDVSGATVKGLKNCKTLNKDPDPTNPLEGREERDIVNYPGFVDCIYLDAPSEVCLDNGLGDTITIQNKRIWVILSRFVFPFPINHQLLSLSYTQTSLSFSFPPMDRAMLMQAEEPWQVIPHPDVRVETADGRSVAVHAKFLTSESDVLRFVLFDRPTKTDGNIPVVPLFGVPYNSVVVFLRCLYLYPSSFSSSPSTSPCWLPKKEEIEKYGVHLLALSHALRVPWLKLAVVNDLVLTMDNVVDMLKLSQLCDAPELTVRSLSMIRRRFTAVVQTDAWEFVKENDPSLELQVLQFMEDFHKRERRRKRMKKNQVVYTALGEAIECLHHICNDGCTMDEQPNGNINIGSRNGKRPCTWGDTCRNLQRKLRHFANCEANKKKTSAITLVDDNECSHCSRMWHLFCLHSALCHGSGICKVPLCSKFKKSNGLNSNSKEWNLLIKKVSSTIVSTRLSSKRHRFGI